MLSQRGIKGHALNDGDGGEGVSDGLAPSVGPDLEVSRAGPWRRFRQSMVMERHRERGEI
jgi:hypothetical protein